SLPRHPAPVVAVVASALPRRLLVDRQAIALDGEATGGDEATTAVAITRDVQHPVERADGLAGQGAIVQPGERTERLEPRGHVDQAVRMERSGTAVVPR